MVEVGRRQASSTHRAKPDARDPLVMMMFDAARPRSKILIVFIQFSFKSRLFDFDKKRLTKLPFANPLVRDRGSFL